MKILLAPSERKSIISPYGPINKNSLSFKEIYDKRVEIIKKFDSFLIKNKDYKNFCKDKTPILERNTQKAILRYSGVAFEALDYQSLTENEKNYLNNNLFIFSNLFGILKPNDLIPFYTLKQGKIPGFNIYNELKELFKPILDSINDNELFIDLRSNFYNKIYKPKNYVTFKFVKNNKIISHFAKYYRGKLVRLIAENNAQNIDDILNINFKEIKITNILEQKNNLEIICSIIE